MQTNSIARLLSLISTQESILLQKAKQSESLSAELNHIDKSRPPYHIGVVLKTGLKLLRIADKAEIDAMNLMVKVREKIDTYQSGEITNSKGHAIESSCELELHGIVNVVAAARVQNICSLMINRASENLCQAQLLLLCTGNIDSAHTIAVPPSRQLSSQFSQLKYLALSYKNDLDCWAAAIKKQNHTVDENSFEICVRRDSLDLIHSFIANLSASAIALIDIAIEHLSSLDWMKAEARKEQTEWLSAYAVTGGIVACMAASFLEESISSLGTVDVSLHPKGNNSATLD